MARRFELRRVWRLGEDEMETGARLLARVAAERFGSFDVVIGIARGGTRPAALVGAALNATVATLTARHNVSDAVYSQGTGRVEVGTPDLPSAARQGRLLVVDDICGSGATLSAVLAVIRASSLDAELRTATLCLNSGSAVRPDLYLWIVSDWVVFPWDARPAMPTEPLPKARTVHIKE